MVKLGLVILNFVALTVFVWITKIKANKTLCPNIIYTAVWCIISLLGIINPLNLLEPSESVFKLITTSIIIFNIIYLLFVGKPNIKDNGHLEYKINNKAVVLLNIIAYILLMPVFASVLGVVINNGFNLLAIRNSVYVGITESNNSIYAILCRTLPSAIFLFTELLSSYYAVKKANKRIFWLGIVDVFVSTIIFGGRSFIMNYVIFYLLNYINLKKDKKIKINKKYIIIGIIALALVTQIRDVNNLSVFDTGVLYYAGSLSFLEYIMKNANLYGLTTLHHGSLTLGFITEPIILILKAFFLPEIKVPSYYFNTYAQKFINIGSESTMLFNNSTTIFYPFMLDFGINGAWIGMIMYALIITIAERIQSKGNLSCYFISIYLTSSIIGSSLDYKLIGLSAGIIIALCLICIRKVKNKSSKEVE